MQPQIHPLRAWRTERGYTLRSLAAQLFDERGRSLVSYATLQRIESGNQEASWPVVRALNSLSGGVLTANDFMWPPAVANSGAAHAGQ
jgi:transcriptional regulator with XRE-family HTH domain